MEILIVGVIIVALMAYASTKIKKSAAQAFEREEIETEDFSIIKPAGFINPINDKSAYPFEAYTKDLGTNAAKNLRQARATLRVVTGVDFPTVCRDTKNSAGRITSKRFVEDAADGRKTFLLESEKIENDVKIFSFWKIIESVERRKIYELQVSVLENHLDEFADAAREMIETFTLK
jgi:hypothetical protein